jgi:hypothetical protein
MIQKKGSKKIRLIMAETEKKSISHNMVKFAETTETVIQLQCSKTLNKSWTLCFLSCSLRTFLFKLHNNTLTVNTRLSHFVRGVSRNCSLCEITRNPEHNDETIFHLFFSCAVSERIRNQFYNWLTNDNNFILSRHEFFCCHGGGNESRKLVLLVTNSLIMKFIWDCKLRLCIPTTEGLISYIKSEMQICMAINRNFNLAVANSGFNFFVNRVPQNF